MSGCKNIKFQGEGGGAKCAVRMFGTKKNPGGRGKIAREQSD